jgi:CubicO group peptidase (beta-lactamase class C family)
MMLTRTVVAIFAVAALGLTPPLFAQQAGSSARPTTKPARTTASQSAYFPSRFDWQHRKPDEVGMSAARIEEAVQIAIAAETPGPRDMAAFLQKGFSREPNYTIIGPVKDRGPASGLVTRRGYIVAEWGDPGRADISNSVTKTFLTTVVGLAWQRGLIRDVNDTVRGYMPPHVDLFEAPHNQAIQWDHLLRQTSDWQGALWDKADWADRPVGDKPEDWPNRKLWEPGTHFKYNDVRVNVLALAALHVWRRPLPEVLREAVMDPIGASSTWRWYGYDNSWVEIDGHKMQSVSGGGHWGGGMFINAYDMARFGYLFLRNGKWQNREIVSEQWIRMARTPGADKADYGYANWYLNTGRKSLPAAPATAVQFLGNGTNVIYVDWENDIVAVVRWIKDDRELNNFIGTVLAAIR